MLPKAIPLERWASWAFPLVLILPCLVNGDGVQIEVNDNTNERTYPWQLCRGTQGLGIGDQVFAIDREITTCANENADEYWFATPADPENPGIRDSFYYDPDTTRQIVNLGGPPRTDPPSPKIYMEEQRGSPLTMEIKKFENWPLEFKIKRDGEILNIDRPEMLTESGGLDLRPYDRVVYYGHIHNNRRLRMPLGYIKRGSTFRLGYRITQGLLGTPTEDYPAVSFVVSDGSVWEGLTPLTDEQRQEYIAALGSQEPKSLQEVQFENQKIDKPGTGITEQKGGWFDSIGRFASRIGSAIRRPSTITPQVQPQEEEEKEQEPPVRQNYGGGMQVSRFPATEQLAINMNYFGGPQQQQQQPANPQLEGQLDPIEALSDWPFSDPRWPFNDPRRGRWNADRYG